MRRFLVTASACLLAIASGAQSASPRAGVQKKASVPGRMVCRTYVRIGTLADRHRICKTQAEWNEERNLRELEPSEACKTNDDAFAPCK
ncbi:MAG: hypothetical protein QOJ91_1453 [Sphingomonadales bacterium]|jgi:hypothetical protein|nr:hypothetical protein [Sphingomonadales bacterium]